MKAARIWSRFLSHIWPQGAAFAQSGTHRRAAAFYSQQGASMSASRVCFAFAALTLALPSAAWAQSQPQTNAPGDEKGAFSILFENDIFDNTDHDYTNGVELGYTTSPNGTPQWAVNAARALPFFAQTGDVRTRYAIGQAIFTPTNISLVNPPLTDRPYAGFLYTSMGLVADDGIHLDQLQVTLGVVGPDSLAENSQNFVHDIIH